MKKLLLVESPSKCKTIQAILGSEWQVEASFGHFTELSKDGDDRLGFTMHPDTHQIECRYQLTEGKGKQVVSKLRAAVKNASEVVLATDGDREGEGIAWHLQQQLKLPNPKRAVYNQITPAAVKSAIANAHQLDLNLISAQRARQCLDRLIGFKVSPLVRQTSGGSSAGRVQSVALHIVCQREREISNFHPQDYWSVWTEYSEGFKAYYAGREEIETAVEDAEVADDATESKHEESVESQRVLSEQEATEIVEIARQNPHVVKDSKGVTVQKSPPPPFITSSLQQVASVRFGLSPEETMKIAQELFEGVDLPQGRKGLITYHRTDSTSLAPEFCAEVKEWLLQHDPDNVPPKTTRHREKENAQSAHEAIRPTYLSITPESVKEHLSDRQYQLYELIWLRAVASQCANAVMQKSCITIQAGSTLWQTKGSILTFAGYTRYWNDLSKDKHLPELTEGQSLFFSDIGFTQKQTQPPSRYSEAKLVQVLEHLGVGRPSTFAAIVKTIKERAYVVLQGKVLLPSALGMSTDEVLHATFPDLLRADFTAGMETHLDDISVGKLEWQSYLIDWHQSYFQPMLTLAYQNLGSEMYVSTRQNAVSDVACPQCQQFLSKIFSKKVSGGHFLKCEHGCENLVLFWSDRRNQWELPQPKAEKVTNADLTDFPCPVCRQPLVKIPYRKDGVDKVMLKCSDTKASQKKDHAEVVYFWTSQGHYWSKKFGQLASMP
ncbi:MAG: type I DNA topoisomerase [Pseudanabaena sp. M38BS1SP1A06MG]|nr:type I DNA topoisomerase [Pseudanabaena sp. M53BS1SP1A06MG]MCA6592815.1 type I DNA topoisomerase [Pseudanabaena sp. M38BS1SP1A06MG]